MDFDTLNQLIDSVALAVAGLAFVWLLMRHNLYSGGTLLFGFTLLALEVLHLGLHVGGDAHAIDPYKIGEAFRDGQYLAIIKVLHVSLDDIVVIMAAFLAVAHIKQVEVPKK